MFKTPVNAVTGEEYKGKNVAILLQAGAELDGGKDPRWCGFVQAKQKGWHVKKGEKGTRIAFWKVLGGGDDTEITLQDATDGKRPMCKHSYVWHASQIAGIPAWEG